MAINFKFSARLGSPPDKTRTGSIDPAGSAYSEKLKYLEIFAQITFTQNWGIAMPAGKKPVF